MNKTEIKNRTEPFAPRTLYMVEALPRSAGADVLRRPVANLSTEAGELTAIAVSSIRNARRRSGNPQSAIRSPKSK